MSETTHRCTDPDAVLTNVTTDNDESLLRIVTADPGALLIEFRGEGDVPAVITDLATGWTEPVFKPLVVAALKHSIRPSAVASQSWLTAADIARIYGLRPNALRMRLDRYRHAHKFGDGYKEFQGGATLKPTYLYLVSAVLDIIRAAQRA